MLVREELITPNMATSLMNDSAYARHASNHLVDMAMCVYAADDLQDEFLLQA